MSHSPDIRLARTQSNYCVSPVTGDGDNSLNVHWGKLDSLGSMNHAGDKDNVIFTVGVQLS